MPSDVQASPGDLRAVGSRELQPGSNRQFGLVMAGAFALLGLISLWDGWGPWTIAFIVLSAAFLLAALGVPTMLAPLNRLWFRLGLLLHRITTPIVLGLMFFVVITPIALIMRALGKRPIALGFDRAAASYWVKRATPAPGPMSKQY